MMAELPTVLDVARVIHRRAKTAGAGQAPTFNDTTKPTGDEVDEHIADAAIEVYGELGAYDTLSDEQQAYTARCIAVLAGANIELTYWPEQTTTRTGQSPYEHLMARYERLLKIARNPGADHDGDGGSEASGTLIPRAVFPSNEGGLVGWGTEL
jgi:hypothetical protein